MKRLPSSYISIVAESVRQEMGGKISLLGVYADGHIRVARGTATPALVPLAFYFLFTDGEGEFSENLRVASPTGDVILNNSLGPVRMVPSQPMSVALNVPGWVFPVFGRYVATVTLDDRNYDRPFVLEED